MASLLISVASVKNGEAEPEPSPFFVSPNRRIDGPSLDSARDRPWAKAIGPIAQLAEHRADNAGVSGAIPLRPTNSLFEHEPCDR